MHLPPRLQSALVAIAVRLDAAGVAWLLAGSAGRVLLGASRRPRDIDLEVPAAQADRAARALGLVAAAEQGHGWSSVRAVGRLAGVDVDVSADVGVAGPRWTLAADDAAAAGWAIPVTCGGRRILAAPPEEALVRAIIAEDWSRIAALAAQGGPAPRPDYMSRRLAAASAVR